MNTEDKKYIKGKEVTTIRADLTKCKFTCINDAVFKNDFLSPEIKGIIVEHLSMSDTWQFRVNYLEDKYGYGSATTAKISNTLHAFGYLYLHRSAAGADGGWIETRKFYANPYDNPHNRFDFNFKTNKKEPKFLYKGAYNPDGSLTEPFKLWYTETILTPYLSKKPKPKTKYVTKHTTPYTTYDNAVSSQTEDTGSNAVSFNGEPRAETLARAVSFNGEASQMKDISNTNCGDVQPHTEYRVDTSTNEGIQSPLGASSPLKGNGGNIEPELEQPPTPNPPVWQPSDFFYIRGVKIPKQYFDSAFTDNPCLYPSDVIDRFIQTSKVTSWYGLTVDPTGTKPVFIKLFPNGLPIELSAPLEALPRACYVSF